MREVVVQREEAPAALREVQDGLLEQAKEQSMNHSLMEAILDAAEERLEVHGIYLCPRCRVYFSRSAATAANWQCCGRLLELIVHEKEDYDS